MGQDLSDVTLWTSIVTALATAILAILTAWYAKKTHDIAAENRDLVAATREMARATESMAAVAADDLYLAAAPILSCQRTEEIPTGGGEARLLAEWQSLGRTPAGHDDFGIAVNTPGGVETRWGFESAQRHIGEGTIEVVYLLPSDLAPHAQRDLASVTFLAKYSDLFGNRYVSRFRTDSPLEVIREAGDRVGPSRRLSEGGSP